MRAILFLFLVSSLCFSPLAMTESSVIRVGSKNFTESYILGEMIAQVAEAVGDRKVVRQLGLGGTGITYEAIRTGAIDIYPEYTGTIAEQILKKPHLKSIPEIRSALRPLGLTISESIGFNNTYAIGVRREVAEKLKLETISDLKERIQQGNQLVAAIGHEFLNRKDGFNALLKYYGFQVKSIKAMEHALAYEALRTGQADLMDVYSTDASIQKLDLKVLRDDRRFFPEYYSVYLTREDFSKKFPVVWKALSQIQINESEMIQTNAIVALEEKSYAEAALAVLRNHPDPKVQNFFQKEKNTLLSDQERFWVKMKTRTQQHLVLVLVSLLTSILVGIPLGVLAARFKSLGQGVLLVTGLFQTIPSLALLCFLIPLFGTGVVPSLVALFLYGLLPIVRNTYSGMISIDRELLEAADSINLTRFQRLRKVELPLASISILSGIKTSAVINVGTATIAALIGAGGYGAFIVEGLTRNEIQTILNGAIPAALLAIVMHGFFELADRVFIPKGLRS